MDGLRKNSFEWRVTSFEEGIKEWLRVAGFEVEAKKSSTRNNDKEVCVHGGTLRQEQIDIMCLAKYGTLSLSDIHLLRDI